MPPSPLAQPRDVARVPINTLRSPKSPKPSAARSDQRRAVQRQERLVSAWLRSLTTR